MQVKQILGPDISATINNLVGDPESLPDLSKPDIVQGRTLVYDADSLCYKAAATVKKLGTGISRFQTGVLEMMYLTKSEYAYVHLTHHESEKTGRGNILGVKPYQANRTGNSRPSLLYPLRTAVASAENQLQEYQSWLHMQLEADDVCMIDSYKLGDEGILYSEDKDLRQTPYKFYDSYLGKVVQAKGIGELWEHVTPAGNVSLHGIGRIFFWAQMMSGDQADNIGGLQLFQGKRVGTVRTLEALEVFNNSEEESDIANFVIDAYRESNQNPWPEGYLLHMLRSWDDSFYKVVQELEWTVENEEFLNECLSREWFKTEGDSPDVSEGEVQ